MFWAKAGPTEQSSAAQLERSFQVIEAPDSVIFLSSIMNILSAGLGYKASSDQHVCVLGDGRPIPMMSYSLIEYLLGLDLSSFDLLELGGGSSTQFWASRTRSVLTLETSPNWGQVAAVASPAKPRSAAVNFRDAGERYDQARAKVRCHRHRPCSEPLQHVKERNRDIAPRWLHHPGQLGLVSQYGAPVARR